MQIVFKRKLFGALLVIAILTVTAIVLINKTKVNQHMVTHSIPLPMLQHKNIKSTIPVDNIRAQRANVQLAATNIVSQSAKKNAAKHSLTQINNQAAVVATKQWALKVASFAQHQAASTLLDRLRNARFNAYLQSKSKGLPNPEYDVMIGPEINQNAFVAMQSQLQQQFNIHAVGIQVINAKQ